MDAKENSIYLSIVIVAVVLGVILGYFLLVALRQQRKNLRLYHQNILAEMTAQEKERSRIASDLHDELGPRLATVKMNVNTFTLTSEKEQLRLQKINGQLDELLQRLREISLDLMPSRLFQKGLIAALRMYIHHLEAGPLKIELDAQPEHLELTEGKALNLYRIVQEIIYNTVKHAGATSLKVQLILQQSRLFFSAQDNGKGFDVNAVRAQAPGMGLKSLVRRVEVMGGNLYIESKPGEGTGYSFEIPLV